MTIQHLLDDPYITMRSLVWGILMLLTEDNLDAVLAEVPPDVRPELESALRRIEVDFAYSFHPGIEGREVLPDAAKRAIELWRRRSAGA